MTAFVPSELECWKEIVEWLEAITLHRTPRNVDPKVQAKRRRQRANRKKNKRK